MTSMREIDLRPTIRDDAATLGYHDELSLDIRYAWREDHPGQDDPVNKSVRRSKRSTGHAIDGLLFGPYVDEDERKETAGRAADILQRWYDGAYKQSPFDDRTRTPLETSAGTRFVDLDAPADADVEATIVEADAAMKDEDAASYCQDIIGTYVDTQIDSGLWREKPAEVRDILERTGDTFLADLVETYARRPAITIGRTVYTEHVDPAEAEAPDEYLDGLEAERFQPI